MAQRENEMITLPIELEQQVIQFAEFEQLDPVSFLKRVINDYSLNRATSNNVQSAFADSLLEFDELYTELAK